MKKILENIKIFVKRFKILFLVMKPFISIVKIILDKRYLYHYLQGLITNIKTRNNLAKIEANLFKSEKRSSDKTDIIRENSYIENPLAISNEKVVVIKNFLKDLNCYENVNSSLPFHINSRPSDCRLAFYNSSDLFKSETILELAVNPDLINIFNDLHGCDPIIDHIAAWWTFPSDQNHETQYWHRDIDTLNQLKFLIYLTDVDLNSGPHYLIPGSHVVQIKTSKDKKHVDEEFAAIVKECGSKVFTGPAGTNFLENTFAFHKGTNPKDKPRLLLEIIYSRVPTPFSDKKPFISLNKSEHSSLIKENIKLFKGKVKNIDQLNTSLL